MLASSHQASELWAKAEDARRRADACNNLKERLVQLRRMQDFEKLAEEAKRS
jgi:hypothetical protein